MGENEGGEYVKRFIGGGLVRRVMLLEGSWEKYDKKDSEVGKKYVSMGKEGGEKVLGKREWEIWGDLKSVLG